MDKYKNIIFIMEETSVDVNESDDDVEYTMEVLLKFNSELIKNVKKEYPLALKDEGWNWLTANEITRFVGDNDLITADDVHEMFKEKIWSVIKSSSTR